MKTSPKILIIDDEPDNFDVIDTLLESEGYHLSYASNGNKALNLLKTFLPDVILLDVMMPQMNGIEFCQRFKSHLEWKHIPVIIVTALSSKEDLSKCLAMGADDFISKPVNGIELRARVKSMLRIKQQHDALQATMRLREDLSQSIVHDLRNPLSIIMSSAAILQTADCSPERLQTKTMNIIVAGQRLELMINNLLLMAKLESGKMVLTKTEVDLHNLCASALSDLEPLAVQNKRKLIGNLPVPGGTICVDTALFRRVIDNLLSNAIKFAPPDSEIVLSADYTAPGRARIQVADSGLGVKEELHQIIFEKYEIGTPIKPSSQLGLGLAFCKMAVEAHGGSIIVENNLPQGSIFTIEV
ncbi:hybrid sensor histidine kinase/response regulator [Scytonema sp. NUACC21]